MTRGIYYTATTLDGFLADEHDSLSWLLDREAPGDDSIHDYERFIAGIGAIAMGATTYQWILDNHPDIEAGWPYQQPVWVFTHRRFPETRNDIRFVSGEIAEHWGELAAAAGERDVWVAGGGDLAAQFAEAGRLDAVMASLAPVTLGAGRPLFPRRWELRLRELQHVGDFACLTYDVLGPLA